MEVLPTGWVVIYLYCAVGKQSSHPCCARITTFVIGRCDIKIYNPDVRNENSGWPQENEPGSPSSILPQKPCESRANVLPLDHYIVSYNNTTIETDNMLALVRTDRPQTICIARLIDEQDTF